MDQETKDRAEPDDAGASIERAMVLCRQARMRGKAEGILIMGNLAIARAHALYSEGRKQEALTLRDLARQADELATEAKSLADQMDSDHG